MASSKIELTNESEVDTVVKGTSTKAAGIQVEFGLEGRANNLLSPFEINAGQLGGVVENTTALELTLVASVVSLGEINIKPEIISGNGNRGGGKGEEADVDGELHFELIKECNLLKKQGFNERMIVVGSKE